MYFEPNEDQATFLTVLEQMSASADAAWKASPDWARYDWSDTFDQTLEVNGFYDCAEETSLGAVAATAMVYRVNSLPVTVESAASSLLRSTYAPALPRPVAVVEGNLDQAIRFLPVAKSIIQLDGDSVRSAILDPGMAEPVESLFAYPMGVIRENTLDWQPVDADPDKVRDRWRVALAAEIAGSLNGGLEAVLSHVRDRKQFGRALGSFQTIQHRLAEASVGIEASYLLALKAAQTGDAADAATALGYVQDASTAIAYDFHQFMGAMGLTLEHPLHRWTYRAKLLRSSLGGAHGNQLLASQRRWGTQ